LVSRDDTAIPASQDSSETTQSQAFTNLSKTEKLAGDSAAVQAGHNKTENDSTAESQVAPEAQKVLEYSTVVQDGESTAGLEAASPETPQTQVTEAVSEAKKDSDGLLTVEENAEQETNGKAAAGPETRAADDSKPPDHKPAPEADKATRGTEDKAMIPDAKAGEPKDDELDKPRNRMKSFTRGISQRLSFRKNVATSSALFPAPLPSESNSNQPVETEVADPKSEKKGLPKIVKEKEPVQKVEVAEDHEEKAEKTEGKKAVEGEEPQKTADPEAVNPVKTQAADAEAVHPAKTQAADTEAVSPVKTQAADAEAVNPAKTQAAEREKADEGEKAVKTQEIKAEAEKAVKTQEIKAKEEKAVKTQEKKAVQANEGGKAVKTDRKKAEKADEAERTVKTQKKKTDEAAEKAMKAGVAQVAKAVKTETEAKKTVNAEEPEAAQE
jgi:hypothetical protein